MRKTKNFAAFALAFLIIAAASVFPFARELRAESAVQPAWTVPAGYNAHDYDKCAAFFELTDENGVKNGEKMGSGYNVNDPETWISIDIWDDVLERVIWTEQGGEKHLWQIDVAYMDAVGALVLSDCAYLEYVEATDNRLDSINTRGCHQLRELYCDNNGLGSIDVSDNPLLYQLWCDGNGLTELDLSHNPMLYVLDCNNNRLSSLDLSSNTALYELYCEGNGLAALDLSANTQLGWLWCPNNELTALDISNNPQLKKVYCANNRIQRLDTSNNAQLNLLDCINNALCELDVSANPLLKELTASGNPLTKLILNDLLAPSSVRAEGSGTFSYHYSVPYSEGFLYAAPSENAEFLGWYTESGALINSSENIAIFGLSHPVVIARFTSNCSPVAGDADGNGSVSIADAVLVLRCAMGLTDESLIDTEAADMDGNGSITVSDSISILRLSIGL